MSVSYKKLWKLLIDKDITKTQLRIKTGISTSTLAKLSKDQYVSLEVLEKICVALCCNLEEIVDFKQN